MSHMAETAIAAKKRFRRPEIEAYLAARRASKGPHVYVVFLGLSKYDASTVHDKVRQGLSFSAFEKFTRVMDLPAKRAAEILLIPPRTLQRRKASGRLEPDESDRLVRLSRVYGKAIELFEGDRDAAIQWLQTPSKALGGATPQNMSQTEPGVLEVEHLIGRLEHGVFS